MKTGKVMLLSGVVSAAVAYAGVASALNIWVVNHTTHELSISEGASSGGVCNWNKLVVATVPAGLSYKTTQPRPRILIAQIGFPRHKNQGAAVNFTITQTGTKNSFDVYGQSAAGSWFYTAYENVKAIFSIKNTTGITASLDSGYQNLYIHVGSKKFQQTTPLFDTNEERDC